MFKIGQRVYTTEAGWGTVKAIDVDREYPIRVVFDKDAYSVTYTLEGIKYKGRCRVLFFKEIVIPPDALEPPWEPAFVKGDIVEARVQRTGSKYLRVVVRDEPDNVLCEMVGERTTVPWPKCSHTFRKVGSVL